MEAFRDFLALVLIVLIVVGITWYLGRKVRRSLSTHVAEEYGASFRRDVDPATYWLVVVWQFVEFVVMAAVGSLFFYFIASNL